MRRVRYRSKYKPKKPPYWILIIPVLVSLTVSLYVHFDSLWRQSVLHLNHPVQGRIVSFGLAHRSAKSVGREIRIRLDDGIIYYIPSHYFELMRYDEFWKNVCEGDQVELLVNTDIKPDYPRIMQLICNGVCYLDQETVLSDSRSPENRRTGTIHLIFIFLLMIVFGEVICIKGILQPMKRGY